MSLWQSQIHVPPQSTRDAFAFDVTACRYAEFYKQLGEPELGFLLVCSGDFAVAEGFGPNIKLARTQTIMQVQVTATFDTTDWGLSRRNRPSPERGRLEYQREMPTILTCAALRDMPPATSATQHFHPH
jgi:hypothetical protein